jgi:hypothetical protein
MITRGAYSWWQELSDNYLLGRRFWGGRDETQPQFETRARWLTTDPHSLWRRLAWSTLSVSGAALLL